MKRNFERLNANQRKHLAAFLSPDRHLYWFDGRVMAALARRGLLRRDGNGEWDEVRGVRSEWATWLADQKREPFGPQDEPTR